MSEDINGSQPNASKLLISDGLQPIGYLAYGICLP